MSKTAGTRTISNLQFYLVMIASIVAFGHFVYVHLVMLYAGRDSWISLFAAVLFGGIIAYVHLGSAKSSPDYTLVELSQRAWGKWLGSAISLLYMVYFIFIGAVTVRILSTFIGLIFPATPSQVWIIAIFILVAWALREEVEVMARTIQLLLPLLIVLGLSASLFLLPDRDPMKLLPIMDHGILPVWQGTVIFIAMISELVIGQMFIPQVKNPPNLLKQGWMVLGVLLIMFIGPITGPIMIFGENLAKAFAYPTYAELEYIEAGDVVQRLDLFGVILWMIGGYFRITVFSYAALQVVNRLTGAIRPNAYAIPVAGVVIAIGLDLPLSRPDTYSFLLTGYPIVSIAIGVLMPLLTSLLFTFRNRKLY